MICLVMERFWASVSGSESSSRCRSVNAWVTSALARVSSSLNSLVASMPNWAWAKPSSCSDVLSESSISTRAALARLSSSSMERLVSSSNSLTG